MDISLVIPTLNSARTLRPCLQAILNQNYPRHRYEIIIADAGSEDDTRAIARSLGVDHVVENPLRTGEAGKSAGIHVAGGDIIALIDSDNIIDDPEWINRMLTPFSKPDIMASEPLHYTYRPIDPPLTRYFAMLGMNDPLCLFLGNYDRFSLITGRWTELPVVERDTPDWLEITLEEEHLPTIGANGFVFRRSLLEKVTWSPYFFDIDIMHQAVQAGFNKVAKVKCGIVHLYCSTLRDFARKQDRRIKDFLFFASQKGRTYPWHRQSLLGVVFFAVATVGVFPLLFQMGRGWRKQADRAWFYHLPVCWITLWIYGRAFLQKTLGIKPKAKSRGSWRQ